MSTAMLDAAREYIARGFSVIPLKERSKYPALTSWVVYQKRRATEEELNKWFGNGSQHNIGIVTGAISGLAVVDLDTAEAVEFAKQFPQTPTARTGKGKHLYYQYRKGVRNFQKRDDLPGVDLRGDGGYVVAPPSVHTSGRLYQWEEGRGLDLPLVDLPELVLAKKTGHKKPLKDLYHGADEGSRNNTLARLCGSWARDGLSFDECLASARTWNEQNRPQMPDAEMQRTVKSIFDRHRAEKTAALITGIIDSDLANARRLVDRHGADLRHTPERGWLVFDGQRWRPDDALAMLKAKDAAQAIFDEIGRTAGPEQGTVFKWARRSQAADRLRAMLFLTESEPGIASHYGQFDRDQWLFNCINGTVDLRSGTLREHRRDDLCGKITPVKFDPAARCDLWLKFLHRVTGGNDELINYLQRAAGYSLTGNTGEQSLIFLHGGGANGKSVFIETLLSMTGEYGLNSSFETFTLKKGGIPNDIARLAGARLVTVSETSEGQRLNEQLIKDLTGSDTISARFLYRESFDFRPEFKLWIRGNHKPQIRGTDDAIWRRIHLVPFNIQIPPAERDKGLLDKLRGELPGILAWAVRGCLNWQSDGLQPPDEVNRAVMDYRTEMDALGIFIDECCIVGRQYQAAAKDIYTAYQEWAKAGGEHPVNQRRFGMALSERGYVREKTRSGYVYHGIGLTVNLVNDCEPFSSFFPIKTSRVEKNLKVGSQGSQGSHEADGQREELDIDDDGGEVVL